MGDVDYDGDYDVWGWGYIGLYEPSTIYASFLPLIKNLFINLQLLYIVDISKLKEEENFLVFSEVPE